MTSKTQSMCPEWCTNAHTDYEIRHQDFFHGTSFGTYNDGTAGIIDVGIGQIKGVFQDRDIVIDTVQMTSAQDLRELASVCLRAAKWVEENLESDFDLVTHGN